MSFFLVASKKCERMPVINGKLGHIGGVYSMHERSVHYKKVRGDNMF